MTVISIAQISSRSFYYSLPPRKLFVHNMVLNNKSCSKSSGRAFLFSFRCKFKVPKFFQPWSPSRYPSLKSDRLLKITKNAGITIVDSFCPIFHMHRFFRFFICNIFYNQTELTQAKNH